MCGRYYVDDETSREIRKILEQLDAKYENNKRKSGEIFPTDTAPILAAYGKNIEPELSVWGFPNYYKKGVLINARAESVLDKKTFRESVFSRRCVIPSSGFYEWDRNKKKFLFKREESETLYMAGLYNFFNEECRFVILTTQANQSMNDIHDRMPVVLEKEEIEQWIMDNNSTSRILNQVPPVLARIS
ncbi:SOS response-associated peptidase [Anaerocolumna sedimenticola]|uniref:Abasic site processing protein n=1 Tax=Anaerocolumna sedimenticola TaxID=2696063 RepID=A0A6P1TL26_9FIRM|nr:SOS response-associated peptidase [Anaerocolumna sedimenticola]QHQ61920.1 SOS response-associated peptidase [Anaerocolumna sedimenticola]